MLFNSAVFLFFFLAVFAVYWLLKPYHKLQNVWLLAASLFFYGYWNYIFLSLLVFTIVLDYYCSLAIVYLQNRHTKRRAFWFLCLSVGMNVFVLICFKYFSPILDVLKNSDPGGRFASLQVIIPIGISFYTFQSISYVVDVYRGKIDPARNLFEYALFVTFFPQLVAGPIERGEDLLPQIQNKHTVNSSQLFDGLLLVILGLYMKVVVADNLLPFSVMAFDSPSPTNSTVELLSIYSAMFQTYADFGGYSYMAVGLGLMLGFKLNYNFMMPYFSSSPSEFWRRWHITGVNWFRTYIFSNLNRLITKKTKISSAFPSLLVTMILFALWHGFLLTFFVWGVSQAVIYAAYHMIGKATPESVRKLMPKWLAILIWFHVASFSAIIYRTKNFSDVNLHFGNLLSGFGQAPPEMYYTLLFFVTPLMVIEYFHWRSGHEPLFKGKNFYLRLLVASFLYFLIVVSAVPDSWSFIYYQF